MIIKNKVIKIKQIKITRKTDRLGELWSRNKAVWRQNKAARLCIRYLILGIKASEATSN